MKAVKVEYTVRPEFIETNKTNIRKVMKALKANPIPGMQYASFTDEQNAAAFIHINVGEDDDTMSKLNDVPEFTDFRMALKASLPVSPPKQTKLDLVEAGFNIYS